MQEAEKTEKSLPLSGIEPRLSSQCSSHYPGCSLICGHYNVSCI